MLTKMRKKNGERDGERWKKIWKMSFMLGIQSFQTQDLILIKINDNRFIMA